MKKCGNAGDNVYLLMKGGCGKDVAIEEAYRCIGCGKWFHFDCLLNHFELEEGQDNARYYLKQIQMRTKDNIVKRWCRLGLERKKPTISFPKI